MLLQDNELAGSVGTTRAPKTKAITPYRKSVGDSLSEHAKPSPVSAKSQGRKDDISFPQPSYASPEDRLAITPPFVQDRVSPRFPNPNPRHRRSSLSVLPSPGKKSVCIRPAFCRPDGSRRCICTKPSRADRRRIAPSALPHPPVPDLRDPRTRTQDLAFLRDPVLRRIAVSRLCNDIRILSTWTEDYLFTSPHLESLVLSQRWKPFYRAPDLVACGPRRKKIRGRKRAQSAPLPILPYRSLPGADDYNYESECDSSRLQSHIHQLRTRTFAFWPTLDRSNRVKVVYILTKKTPLVGPRFLGLRRVKSAPAWYKIRSQPSSSQCPAGGEGSKLAHPPSLTRNERTGPTCS